MKKILFLFAAAVVLCGCGSVKYSQATFLADYRSYQEDGFLITPSSSGFVYESVGDIAIRFVPGEKKGYENPNKTYWGNKNWFEPTYDYIVAEMVKQAKELGANALLNFKITVSNGNYWASGFAVKLKE